MWLRSLEEAAAEQAAEHNAAMVAAAQAHLASAPGSAAPTAGPERPVVAAQSSSSRSTERVSKAGENDDEDDSLSDDSGSELPPGTGATNSTGLPFPRSFEEFRKYWGTRLKDIAAQFGVPESGLSKVRVKPLARYDARTFASY